MDDELELPPCEQPNAHAAGTCLCAPAPGTFCGLCDDPAVTRCGSCGVPLCGGHDGSDCASDLL